MTQFGHFPERLQPYLFLESLNQNVPVAPGPLRMSGPTDGLLQSGLSFRWLPSTAIEFEENYERAFTDLESPQWILSADGENPFSTCVHVTSATLGLDSSKIRGVTREPFSTGGGPFESLRFCLANFPNYIGSAVRYAFGGGDGFMRARVEAESDKGAFVIDEIPEAAALIMQARRDAGFVVSHVGRWVPTSGSISTAEAERITRMLHFWFGFLRGAWAGPLFAQGLNGQEVVWRHYAAWKCTESQYVNTWLPDRTPNSLSIAVESNAIGKSVVQILCLASTRIALESTPCLALPSSASLF